MRIAFIVFIALGPAASASAALTDLAVISDPFFRYSITGAAICPVSIVLAERFL
jgi:hypothetical protein